MERGSRSYISPVEGSSTSQKIAVVVWAKNGSMCAVGGSGIRVMSEASMPFQPAIEEPSKAKPSANMPSLTHEPSAVTCCILPLVSVKRRSTNFTSLSFIILSTSLAFFALSAIATPLSSTHMELVVAAPVRLHLPGKIPGPAAAVSDRVRTRLAGANADGFLDGGDEDLAVADASRLGGLLDGLERLRQHLVAEHHLDFHLGQEVDHVFRPAVELGVALLAAETLGLNDRNALQADLLQILLHLLELEGLDDGFDFLHACFHLPTGRSRGRLRFLKH